MGQAEYQIRVYDPQTGTRQAIITTTEFRNFYLERTVNGIDTLTLAIDESSPNIQYFVTDAIIEVWRRIDRVGAVWYIESTLLHRTPQHDFTEQQRRIFTSYSRGLVDLLHRRSILYFANTAFTLKSGPGETVMKEFVEENAGPGAASALRRSSGTWTGPITGLTVQFDNGNGANWAGARAWKNLLDTLQEISVATSVDFDVIRTGPLTFEFRTYYPQLGQDLSNTVLFSPGFGNMTDILFIKSRTEEANAVLILGQGEQTTRVMWPQADAVAGADSPWNVIETIRDARSQPTLTELQSEATEALNELKAQNDFNFKVLQTDPRQYGNGAEYWLGYIVRAQYEGTNVIRKIVGANISLGSGKEDISLIFSEFPDHLD